MADRKRSIRELGWFFALALGATKLDPTRPPLRWLLRLPSLLYTARLGWLLGERFAQRFATTPWLILGNNPSGTPAEFAVLARAVLVLVLAAA